MFEGSGVEEPQPAGQFTSTDGSRGVRLGTYVVALCMRLSPERLLCTTLSNCTYLGTYCSRITCSQFWPAWRYQHVLPRSRAVFECLNTRLVLLEGRHAPTSRLAESAT